LAINTTQITAGKEHSSGAFRSRNARLLPIMRRNPCHKNFLCHTAKAPLSGATVYRTAAGT